MCQDKAQMLMDGDWGEAIICFLTAGQDPTLMMVVPTAIYGMLLVSLFIYGLSGVMPAVVSIILAGVIVAAFPAPAVSIVVMMVMFLLAAGGQVLVWRMGR